MSSCAYIPGLPEDVKDMFEDVTFPNVSDIFGPSAEPDTDTGVYLTEVEENLNYTGADKQNVVIDLSGRSSQVIGKTVTIGGDVTQVVFRGKEGSVYSSLNIVVASHNNLPLTIVLENMNITGDSPRGTIFCENGRSLTIKSSGQNNSVTAANNSPAISAPNSTLQLDGNALITFLGGQGLNGQVGNASTGYNGSIGSIGGTALVASHVEKYGAGTVKLIGGNGGSGGDGAHGAVGNTGSYGDGSIFVTQSKPVGTAGSGTAGSNGGNGGNGGDGGLPLNPDCRVVVHEGTLHLQVGNGGKGGNGGNGGNGGVGGTGGNADKGSWMFGAGWTYGSNGGKGGNGGNGGNGGDGGMSDAGHLSYDITVESNAHGVLQSSNYGAGGSGGNGGNGGVGGIGGSCDDTVTGKGCNYYGQACTCGGKGGNGGNGGNGGSGGNGSTAGKRGAAGNGGSGGVHSTEKYTCSCEGSGSSGSNGGAGNAGKVINSGKTIEIPAN